MDVLATGRRKADPWRKTPLPNQAAGLGPSCDLEDKDGFIHTHEGKCGSPSSQGLCEQSAQIQSGEGCRCLGGGEEASGRTDAFLKQRHVQLRAARNVLDIKYIVRLVKKSELAVRTGEQKM